MNILAVLMVALGVFAMAAAIQDWDFFLNARRAGFFVQLFGRRGARVVYLLLGAVLMLAGLAMTFGPVS